MTISFPASQGTIASVSAVVTVSEGTVDVVTIIAVAAVVTVALVVAAFVVILVVETGLLAEDQVCLPTNWSRCCK